jgi:hypothetical protein
MFFVAHPSELWHRRTLVYCRDQRKHRTHDIKNTLVGAHSLGSDVHRPTHRCRIYGAKLHREAGLQLRGKGSQQWTDQWRICSAGRELFGLGFFCKLMVLRKVRTGITRLTPSFFGDAAEWGLRELTSLTGKVRNVPFLAESGRHQWFVWHSELGLVADWDFSALPIN